MKTAMLKLSTFWMHDIRIHRVSAWAEKRKTTSEPVSDLYLAGATVPVAHLILGRTDGSFDLIIVCSVHNQWRQAESCRTLSTRLRIRYCVYDVIEFQSRFQPLLISATLATVNKRWKYTHEGRK